MGQSDWFWNNRTRINEVTYPTANAYVCQQMTWPLTYKDGINLRGKVCGVDAYFMCQIKCKILTYVGRSLLIVNPLITKLTFSLTR